MGQSGDSGCEAGWESQNDGDGDEEEDGDEEDFVDSRDSQLEEMQRRISTKSLRWE